MPLPPKIHSIVLMQPNAKLLTTPTLKRIRRNKRGNWLRNDMACVLWFGRKCHRRIHCDCTKMLGRTNVLRSMSTFHLSRIACKCRQERFRLQAITNGLFWNGGDERNMDSIASRFCPLVCGVRTTCACVCSLVYCTLYT